MRSKARRREEWRGLWRQIFKVTGAVTSILLFSRFMSNEVETFYIVSFLFCLGMGIVYLGVMENDLPLLWEGPSYKAAIISAGCALGSSVLIETAMRTPTLSVSLCLFILIFILGGNLLFINLAVKDAATVRGVSPKTTWLAFGAQFTFIFSVQFFIGKLF